MKRLIHKAKDKFEQKKQTTFTTWHLEAHVEGDESRPENAVPPPIPPNKPGFVPHFSQDYISLYPHPELIDHYRICFQALPTSCQPKDDCKDIHIADVSFLGDVHSRTSLVKRDLGFQGQIGQYILLSYGDTLYSDSMYSDTWRGMTSNSIAFATHDPLTVIDSKLNENQYPEQFVAINESWGETMADWALGITNVIETSPGSGMLFYLLNHRPPPARTDHLVGAGIARVSLDYSKYPPVPHAERLGRNLWDGESEPWYGDVGAVSSNGYIYAYGHCKDTPFVYLARVRTEDWDKLECYEYWHGKLRGWTHARLLRNELGEEQSVFWQVNQGQVIWNEYLKRFLFIYCDNFWDKTVILRHAPAPEGPWSQNIDVYKGDPISKDGNIYAAVPHPYFDLSGKTLVITFTNLPNCIQAIRVTFS